jgi:CheY-like chemotaxis protein/two-component sensor histidine kinase
MEADLRSAIIRLQELDRIRSDFVHNVSHELKTPVASIMYAARNLVRGVTGSLPEKAVRYVRLIEGESLRLSRTVEDILDMRMLETHTLQLARTRLPIARVVGRLAEILQTQAKERRLRLMITADPRAGFVNCDAEKIERVFQNILTNALKFTPAGGAVEVTVCRDPEDHARVLIAVEDNGIGIPPEALPRVTERYFRAGNHPRGAGLGLSIAAELVHLHDGTLELLSPPPGKKQGTLVYLRLPVANPAVILVVDDNTATRDTVQRHLASYGFIVILADGEEESLTQADKEKPDGVILNAATGYDAAIHLKRYKALRDIPAVAVAEGPLDKPTQKVFDDLAIPVVPTLIHRNALVDTLEDVLVGRSVFAERTDSDPERRAPHERKQRADRAGR